MYRRADMSGISDQCIQLSREYLLISTYRPDVIEVFTSNEIYSRESEWVGRIRGKLSPNQIVRTGRAVFEQRHSGAPCIDMIATVLSEEMKDTNFVVPFCGNAIKWLKWDRVGNEVVANFNTDEVRVLTCPARAEALPPNPSFQRTASGGR
jgi:hypothetical protein